MGRADTTIVWFKRDLRTVDHRPLAAAAADGAVIPLYVVEPEYWAQPDQHARHWEFVRRSVEELANRLGELGAPLVVRVGDVVDVLDTLHVEHHVGRVVAHEETGTDWTYARDRRVAEWARSRRVTFEEWPTNAVVRRLSSRDDWTTIWNQRMGEPLTEEPERLRPVPDLAHGAVDELGATTALPTASQLGLDHGFEPERRGAQIGGRTAGLDTLASFLDARHVGYESKLSSPVTAWDSCSRLSPHLTWGTLSLREVAQAVHRRGGRLGSGDPSRRSLSAFAERLHWRCHFIQKLEDEPEIEFRSFVREFDDIRQRVDEAKLDAWMTGRTGYPMVDAAMRALVETGWINFRMRAMLVSFASYDLWLPWRVTGLHLARSFADFEPGIHWSQMQMQSGTTGINAMRVYDPTKQALDHDPDGEFIRRWVPELRDVPGALVHQPGLAAGDYPPPIVDHAAATRRAKDEVERIRRRARRDGRADAVVEQHGSRRPPPSRRGSGRGAAGRSRARRGDARQDGARQGGARRSGSSRGS